MPQWFNNIALTALRRGGFTLKSFEYRSSPVYYVEGGKIDGPVFVVFPGFGDNIFSWTRFMLRFGRHYRVLGLDFPGYTGKSPHPPTGDILRFSDQEAVAEKFLHDIAKQVDVLVGNSMGGWIALRMAKKHPGKIGEIVALNPAGVFTDEKELRRVRALYDIESYGDYVHMMRHLWAKIPLYFYPFSFFGFYQFTRHPIVRTILDSIEREHFLNDILPLMETPISVVWGERDTLFPKKMGKFIAKTAPNAKYYPIAEAGHMPQVETPDLVYSLMDRILKLS